MAASPTEKSYSLSTMGSSLQSDGKQSRDLEAATVDDAPSMALYFISGWSVESDAMHRLESERMAKILQTMVLPEGEQR